MISRASVRLLRAQRSTTIRIVPAQRRWNSTPGTKQEETLQSDPRIKNIDNGASPDGKAEEEARKDPRIDDRGNELMDQFSVLKEKYNAPQNPIVLCHGLFGFDEIRLAGQYVPGIEYWRGICDALRMHDVEVIIASVPPSASIERRAEALAEGVKRAAKGRKVNLIGHSMGGIDARYMLSLLRPNEFCALSLTTIATPHHGSSFADYLFTTIGPTYTPRILSSLASIGLETGAFSQLTTSYMTQTFNPSVPDAAGVDYFSYGAMMSETPKPWSLFRFSHGIVEEREGPNDGLVSVESAKWGKYEGTLVGVSHLDIINWYNRMEYFVDMAMGKKRRFNAVAFYCALIDNLAKRGF
ncbi:triacylglycerol lipase [Ascodesmis nigricans]|uniref:Triacylglycerol lipase n=1 Tax=Ascodesmis nigricans TaxID=341454 RepID=A0A4V3SJV5_9PEZI|nr:triacylglycerol lipase [Ascodesmis nigricans]